MAARPKATLPCGKSPSRPPSSWRGSSPAPLVYNEGEPATAVTAAITASDFHSTTLAGATIRISGNYRNGKDLLAFANTGSITGAWNATTGTLTLNGVDTVADYRAALRTVTYVDSSLNPSSATRIVSFQVNDGVAESNVVVRQIAVTPVVYAPALAGIESGPLVYTEGGPATAITAAIAASYADNASLVGATIQISGNYQDGEDLLSFTNTANITGSWDATTGTLTLTGVDTVADYQAALRGDLRRRQPRSQLQPPDGELPSRRLSGRKQHRDAANRCRSRRADGPERHAGLHHADQPQLDGPRRHVHWLLRLSRHDARRRKRRGAERLVDQRHDLQRLNRRRRRRLLLHRRGG